MSAVALASVQPTFSERLLDLRDRADYRRADTDDVREAIYRLRYDAYVDERAIKPSFEKRFTDPADELGVPLVDVGVVVGGHGAAAAPASAAAAAAPASTAKPVKMNAGSVPIAAPKTPPPKAAASAAQLKSSSMGRIALRAAQRQEVLRAAHRLAQFPQQLFEVRFIVHEIDLGRIDD